MYKEGKEKDRKSLYPSLWIIGVCILEAARCIYSAKFYQSIDWPCYREDGFRLLSGELDYSKYLCEWGYMYYPAGFAYFYAFLTLITGGEENNIINVHIVLSVVITFLSLKLFEPYIPTKSRYIFLLLPLFAQNVYRAGISRVTNDTWLVLVILLMLHSIVRKKFVLSSIFFSIAVSYKMNSLYFGPSLLLYYLVSMPFINVVIHFFFMGAFQIVVALPFLIENYREYISKSYNFGRDFEHRLNMAWGFLGDSIRHQKFFYSILLLFTLYFLFTFFVLMWRLYTAHSKKWNSSQTTPSKWFQFKDESELALFLFIVPNFIGYTFSRGIHIQFMLWISFSLPYLLIKGSGINWKSAFLLYLLFDWCHSWVPNVIQLGFLSDFFSLLLHLDPLNALQVFQFKVFSQLKSIPMKEAIANSDSVVKILGAFYPYGFSITVVPASFILFSLEMFIIYRILHRCKMTLDELSKPANKQAQNEDKQQ